MKTTFNFAYVIRRLRAKGIYGISLADFREFNSINNYVYYVNKDDVKIILKIGHNQEDIPQYEKIDFVFNFLRKHYVPVPRTIIKGKVTCNDGITRPFLVQELVEAKNLLEIENIHEYYPHIAEILAKLHQFEFSGFGKIVGGDNEFYGNHKTWYSYLKYEIKRSLALLSQHGVIDKNKKDKYTLKFQILLQKYRRVINKSPRRFLHGDIGRGNFLADESEKKIKAVLDVEFALVGDPAWEFAAYRISTEELLGYYMTICKKVNSDFDENNFRLRMSIYTPIKKLIVAAALTKKDTSKVEQFFSEMDSCLSELL